MNTLEPIIILNPFAKEDLSAKFVIDDTTDTYILADATAAKQTYIFSCWIKSEVAGSIAINNSEIKTGSTWSKWEIPLIAADTALIITFKTVGTYYLYQSKLELGNKATDWTPAPEDMATDEDVRTAQDTANSAASTAQATEARTALVEQAVLSIQDIISTLVTDANGETLMTQTPDGWTFSIASLQDAVDAASDSVDALSKELGDTNSTVNVLQQAVDDLGKTAEYVRIIVYEDEPCIELGESDSNFKLMITNTRIMFMDGSDVPTYISNKGLTTKNIEIENDLIQGGYVWRIRANGNLGLMWMGGTE